MGWGADELQEIEFLDNIVRQYEEGLKEIDDNREFWLAKDVAEHWLKVLKRIRARYDE